MKVTRRDFVVRSIAASTMPIGMVSATELGARSLGLPSGIENDMRVLKALRTKAYRAFVVEGRIDEIVALRRQAIDRLSRSLASEARSAEELRLFREAAVFLGRLEDSSIWLPWAKSARDRCTLLRAWGEAGGQTRWLAAERMRQGGRGAEPVT